MFDRATRNRQINHFDVLFKHPKIVTYSLRLMCPRIQCKHIKAFLTDLRKKIHLER